MKRTNQILAIIALSLFAFYGCKKDNLTQTSATTSADKSVTTNNDALAAGGAVYIMDNAAAGNHVIVYRRAENGLLSYDGSFATRGKGNGAGLGSQGVLIRDKNFLYACNTGSNDITVFSINQQGLGLTWVDRVPSHGTLPVSVTVHHDLLYVLNAGGHGNISGFHRNDEGYLSYMSHSGRRLSSDTSGAAQIEFNPSGTQLVVTEKATNVISTYTVKEDGLIDPRVAHPSTGNTPFGFAFANQNQLIVSDAFGGAAGEGALSSYVLSNNGNLHLITGPVATHQTACCWVVVTGDNRFCYTTNTGSNNISGYRISYYGELSLIDANGVTGATGASPIDMSLSNDSRYLYTLNSASGSTTNTISMFRVNYNGGLTSLGDVSGVPTGAAGMAAK